MRICATVVFLGFSGACFGQVLAEHAAGVAGASIGAAAGKPVGEAMGRIFGQTDDAARKAAAKPPSKEAPAPKLPAVKQEGLQAEGGGTIASPSERAALPHRRTHKRPVAEAPEEGIPQPAAVVIQAAPIPVRRLSEEDIRAIQAGAGRGEVIAKLGQPASLVTIPDEGHLLESFKYVAGGQWVGTIRLDNGAVVQVDTAR